MEHRAEEYRAVAEVVVSQLREALGGERKYDKESIKWLDDEFDSIFSFFTIIPKIRDHINTQTPAQ